MHAGLCACHALVHGIEVRYPGDQRHRYGGAVGNTGLEACLDKNVFLAGLQKIVIFESRPPAIPLFFFLHIPLHFISFSSLLRHTCTSSSMDMHDDAPPELVNTAGGTIPDEVNVKVPITIVTGQTRPNMAMRFV